MVDFLKEHIIATNNEMTKCKTAEGKAGFATAGDFQNGMQHFRDEKDKIYLDIEEEVIFQKKYQTDFQNDSLQAIEAHLKKLYKARLRAGLATASQYDNQIDQLKRDRVKIIEDHNCPPTPQSLLCIVLLSSYKHIKKNIASNLFKKLPKNRYHATDLSKFCPFDGEKNIHAILETSKYFTEPIRYVNDTVWNDPLKQDCLARIKEVVFIADVGSLCGENKGIASEFDNSNVKGVLVPTCNELVKDRDWNPYISKRVQDFFPNLHAYLLNDRSCSFYHPISLHLFTFEQNLYRVVDEKNKPTNQIKNGHSGKKTPSFSSPTPIVN